MPFGSTPDSRPSSVVVLGADTVLAALPATPVQLAHACRALGYDVAFPASWGDEVVAAACLERLHEFGEGPAILCSCPLVAERLTRAGEELAPFMLNLAAPPVAAARYLRAIYGERPVRITYAGSCPSASDASIDARVSPEELLLAFEERGIVPAAQPEYFESVLPPDRRRYESLPGGAPSEDRLREVDAGRRLAELSCAEDQIALEIAQRLVAYEHELIDVAPCLRCACSGARGDDETSVAARGRLTALEPPRARAPVLDPSIHVDVSLPALAEPAGSPRYAVARPWTRARRWHAAAADSPPAPTSHGASHGASHGDAGGDAAISPSPARRHAPIIVRRTAGRGPALARHDGAVIPRACAARLRRARPASHLVPRGDSGFPAPSGTIADGARRPRRITRPVIIPLSSELPRVVPPPPARPHADIDDPEIGAVAGDL